MKKYILTIFILSIYVFVYSQDCDMVFDLENNFLKSTNTECDDYLNYAPYPVSEHTPIKRVRVDMHIIQKSDGTGNFQDNPADRDNLNALIAEVNRRLKNIEKVDNGDSPQVQDARIEIELTGIYFYQRDDLIPNIDEGDNPDANWADPIYYNEIITRTDLNTTQKYQTLHIIMMNWDGIILGGLASSFADKHYIYLKGYYHSNVGGFRISHSAHLIHELGHSFGLRHNFKNCIVHGEPRTYCSVCKDIICTECGTSNNYMDYSNNRIAFSKCQIGRMHYFLSGKVGNISDCVIQDYCNYNANKQVSILFGEDVIWNSQKKLLGDLILENDAKLTINCDVSIPRGGKVEVNYNSKLIINSGQFINSCGEYWDGIEVNNRGYCELALGKVTDYPIIVRNGGSLLIKESFELSDNCKILIEEGGYLCIEQGTSINLQDKHSLIQLYPTSNIGINPAITESGNCVSDVINMSYSGAGSINKISSSLPTTPVLQTSDQNRVIFYSDNAKFYVLDYFGGSIISYTGIFYYDDILRNNNITAYNSNGASVGSYEFDRHNSFLCLQNLNFYNNGDLNDANYSTYKASNSIIAENISINNGRLVVFKAGNSIRLKKPFYVDGKSGMFHGYLEDCSISTSSSAHKKSATIVQEENSEVISENTPESNIGLLDEQQVSIFPNPTTGKFNISLSQSSVNVDIYLYNMTGSLLYQKKYLHTNNITIDITDQTSKTVIVKIVTNEGVYNNIVTVIQ